MDEKKRIESLENVIKQMLKPVKDIPLNVIINSLSDCKVIPIDRKKDKKIIADIEKAILFCGEGLEKKPISLTRRVNEVGNDIERYVKEGLSNSGFRVEELKRTGYPDTLVQDKKTEKFLYVECKTYDVEKDAHGSFRSFFLSPSRDFKVPKDACHLVLSLGLKKTDLGYVAREYKIVDVCYLSCDVKYEFNSNNKRMYSDDLIISAGKIAELKND